MGTKTLFQELDLTINTNDRVGMVGHSGSGKSTLLSILEDTEPPMLVTSRETRRFTWKRWSSL